MKSLKKYITFSEHNITHQAPYHDVNIILCRNVFIYFKQALINKIIHQFHSRLSNKGFLVLGQSEILPKVYLEQDFTAVSSADRIYRKV
ncbi:MAG: hypothetical protein HRU15_14960 [Planctomycetes bacterium]|nr:hypothetical protein [Planctomycetota bacterium]